MVLFAIITCCLEIYCVYFLHALIVSSSRKGVEIFIFCLTLLLIGINGFASLCPCYDERDRYIELTTFWFPLFYGFQSTLVLLVLYNKLCDALSDAQHLKVYGRSQSMYHIVIGVVLFMVLLLVLVLGDLGTATLAIYITTVLFIHVATIGLFLSKLIAIFRESGKSYDSAMIAQTDATSPRRGQSQPTNFAEDGNAKQDTNVLVPVSTVSLLAAPVTALIRLATILTISLCVHIAFVIWFSAVFDDEDGGQYATIAMLMYYASTADVFMNFMATMLLHEAMDKEVHFCVRSVPHAFLHPLQGVADAELRAKERAEAEEEAEAMGFPLSNTARDVIIKYEEKPQSAQLDQDEAENLDRYRMQTIEDHASYNRDEDQLNILLDDELAKAGPDGGVIDDEAAL